MKYNAQEQALGAAVKKSSPELVFSNTKPRPKGITDTHFIHAFFAAIAIVVLVVCHAAVNTSNEYQTLLNSEESLLSIFQSQLVRNFLSPMQILAEYANMFSSSSYFSTERSNMSLFKTELLYVYIALLSIFGALLFWYSCMHFVRSDIVDIRTMSLVEQLATKWIVSHSTMARITNYHACDMNVNGSSQDAVITHNVASLLNQQTEKVQKAALSLPQTTFYFPTGLLPLRHNIQQHVFLSIPVEPSTYTDPNYAYTSEKTVEIVPPVKLSPRPWYSPIFTTSIGAPIQQIPFRTAKQMHLFPTTPAIGLFYTKCDPKMPVATFHGLYPKIKLGAGHEQTPDHHGDDHSHSHAHSGVQDEGIKLSTITGDELVFESVDDEILNMQRAYEKLSLQKGGANAANKKNGEANTIDTVYRLETGPAEHARGPVVVLQCPFLTAKDVKMLTSPISVFWSSNKPLRNVYRQSIELCMSGIHVFVTGGNTAAQTLTDNASFPDPFCSEIEQYARRYFLWNPQSGAFKAKDLTYYSHEYQMSQKLHQNKSQDRFTKRSPGALVKQGLDLNNEKYFEVLFTTVERPHNAV